MANFEFTSPEGKKYTVSGPDGSTAEQAFQILSIQIGAPKPSGPTDRQKLLSSAPMRLAKGGKDPIDGAAQFLQNLMPEGVVNAVNSAADFVGGEGTFAGDVLGIKGATPKQLTQDIKSSNTEYENARYATTPNTLSSLITGQKDPGFDGARLLGNVVSPVNMTLGKVLPGGGATKKIIAAKGAAAGAAGASTQPVMDGEYGIEKTKQVALGAVTGGIMAPLVTKAAESVARFIQNRVRAGAIPTPEGMENEIRASFASDDIDVGQIPKEVMRKLTEEAKAAMAAGKQVDAATLLRKLDFERSGIQPLSGQLSRDPTQYSRELNLRGINGVGEPIANRLNQQQSVIAGRLRDGAIGADKYAAGQSLVQSLNDKNDEMVAGVRASYKAFKDSTGRDLEVPLTGLAQDYSKTLRDFGDTIPASVRGQFEELGLLTGKQTKLLSIDDAENLIKVINKNYNPANKPLSTALDELRGHVQNSILEVTDSGAGMEAATLAKMARGAAKDRFDAIRDTPALKAAINGAEPDNFVQKYVIGGKVREINELAKLVGPEGQKTMRQQMLKYLQTKAFGTNAAGDGAGSQASFNKELEAIGRNKLAALLGPEKTDELYSLGRVMAYIQQRPAGASVNESNTGAAVANMLSKIGGTIKGAPYINDFVIKPIGAFKDRKEVMNALRAQLVDKPAELDPQTVNKLARLVGPSAVGSGAALGFLAR